MILVRVICVAIGYLFGLFQTSYLYGRANHMDIREHGSGNAGTTNALRTMGKKAGALTLLGDCLKCVLAIWVVRILYRGDHADILPLLSMYAGAGCILGHNFPIYLNFRGGKGVAASVGLVLALDWRVFVICAVVFFTLYFTTHYVSLCSISAYLVALIVMSIFGWLGYYGMETARVWEMDGVLACLTALAIFRHRQNIRRLLNGNENKIFLKKGKKA